MSPRDAQPAFEGIKSILVPTDGSNQADKAVELASSDIAAKYGAKLVLLYVMWRGPSLEALRAFGRPGPQLSESARDELDPVQHPIAEHVSSTFIPPIVSKDASKEIGEQVLARGRQTAEAKALNVRRADSETGAAGRRPGARNCRDRPA